MKDNRNNADFFPDLADHRLLRRLSGLDLAANGIPVIGPGLLVRGAQAQQHAPLRIHKQCADRANDAVAHARQALRASAPSIIATALPTP